MSRWDRGGSKEPAVLHGVMLAVMRPEGEIMNGSGGGNQSVAEFDVVAFGELPQVVAGAAPNFRSDRHARQDTEQCLERRVFAGPGAMPHFRHGDR